jgi:hypothetical protein
MAGDATTAPTAGPEPWSRRTVSADTVEYLSRLGEEVSSKVASEVPGGFAIASPREPAVVSISASAGSDPDAALAAHLSKLASAHLPTTTRKRRWRR